MSTELTVEPPRTRAVRDRDGDLWGWSGGQWRCATNTTLPRTWPDLLGLFGPIELVTDPEAGAKVLGTTGEVREFDIRRTALLAAATAFKRDGDLEDDWEDHEASIVAKARQFESYLRGETK